jgi:hypothetical protein
VLEHVPYLALGTNCDFRLPKQGVANWVKQHFLEPTLLRENGDISNTRVIFRFEIGEHCRLTIDFRPLMDDQMLRILINCQFDGLDTPLKLIDAISRARDSVQKSERRVLRLVGESS